MTNTNTERNRAFRDRKRQQDEAEVRGVWAPKSLHDALKKMTRKWLSGKKA